MFLPPQGCTIGAISIYRRSGRQRLNAHRFLHDYKDLFTRDGANKSWPRWKDTWKAASAYFEGMLRPGRRKNMQCISHRMMLDEDRIERLEGVDVFVRQTPMKFSEMLSMNDEDFEEYQRIQKEFRDLLRSSAGQKIRAKRKA